jgi:hypothetical protein
MIEDKGEVSTRQTVRELAERFEIPDGTLRRDSKVSAFMRACRVTTTYVEDGRTLTLRNKEANRTSEFITMHIVNDDGFKLAEYKFFQSRRTRVGVVKGSHVVRSVLRQGLQPHQREAAQAWVAAAEEVYARYAVEAPLRAVRRLARVAMLNHGVPIVDRESMYFVYGDEIEVAFQVREFLGLALTEPPPVTIVSVDDFSDYQVFADSADHYLTGQLEAINTRIRKGLDSPHPVDMKRRTNWDTQLAEIRRQQARHERRLSLGLPRTSSTLLVADQLVSQLPVYPACRQ